MRVLILTDADFVRREWPMLQRLEIGLADEGVRVLQASPRSCAELVMREAAAVYSTGVSYHDHGLPWTLGLRATALLNDLQRAAPADADGPVADVVLALGAGAWSLATLVARRIGARLVLEVASPALIRAAAGAFATASGKPPRPRAAPVPTFIAPDPGLVVELARVVPATSVRLVPWGAHPADVQRAPIDPAVSLSVVLIASAHDPEAARGAVQALAHLAALAPGLMVLADADVAERTGLWRMIEAFPALAGRVSLIADVEGRREAVLHADAMLVAQADGVHRSIVLEAMARGTLVFAPPDRLVDSFVDGITCAFIQMGTLAAPLAAAETTATVVRETPRAEALRRSARDFIAAHRSASGQVRAMLDAISSEGSGR
ncbi:MAG: hypothetical protein ACKVS8_14665 [Phycisphaerales bacterium]